MNHADTVHIDGQPYQIVDRELVTYPIDIPIMKDGKIVGYEYESFSFTIATVKPG